MAKVLMPLMSGQASGQLGHAIVFTKANVVRKYVTPANPQTVDQMTVRNILGDVQRELRELGLVLRAEFKAGLGSHWNALIIGELMGDNHANWDALVAAYGAFQAGEKTAWATADVATGLVNTDGACLYAVSKAAYDLLMRVVGTCSYAAPVAANGATIGAAWIANA